jgi:uncharacterized OB-fold protein
VQRSSPLLSAAFTLEYTFKRSLGKVLGTFFAGLRDKCVLGVRTRDGRVLVPPSEYDPHTAEALDELVPVLDRGVVTSFCWVAEPRPKHPLQRPFAFALIKLDGADTALLHVVDAGVSTNIVTGMRVAARWAEDRVGAITDIACFVPECDASTGLGASEHTSSEPLQLQKTPVRLDYTVVAPEALATFLRGLQEGRILGRKDPATNRVYCPPRAGSPTHGTDMAEYVEVADTGTLTTFCIVNVAFEGQVMKVPYVYGAIVLDGADTPFLHLIDVPAEQARMGMRLQVRWKPKQERTGSFTDIACFVATEQPDASFESYREYL